jgi:hypothetical protein
MAELPKNTWEQPTLGLNANKNVCRTRLDKRSGAVYYIYMQTFVPLTESYDDIAKVLDNKRLNKQALEGWQILMVLLELDPQGEFRPAKGWKNHPAVKMWRGYEMDLYVYIQAMVKEWKSRGYNSTIGDKARATILRAMDLEIVKGPSTPPPWVRNMSLFKDVASSHRTALLSKDYEWYSQFGWGEDPGHRPDTYDYIWPIS